jgi:predicted AAA+ superfamily ATPase
MPKNGVIFGIDKKCKYICGVIVKLKVKNRQVTYIVNEILNSILFRIVILTGARQTGKTTMVKNSFKNFKYISIEDPLSVDQFLKFTAKQWESFYPHAILDEVQKEPVLIESIKATYDQSDKVKYILLGSSQIMLLEKVKESLAGRCHIQELYPLVLPEILTKNWDDEIKLSFFQKFVQDGTIDEFPFLLEDKHSDKLKAYNDYLEFGAYPAIYSDGLNAKEKNTWLKNYVRTYFERDIRDLVELRNLEPFTQIQKLVALNTGQILNHTKLANEAKVTSKTVQRFLHYMNLSYQVLILQPWFSNTRKRLVKSPKVHMLDVGVVRTMLQKKGPLTGNEFESAIISEIYKQLKNINIDFSVYHLRTLDGREVDLLIEFEEGYVAIEVKYSSKVRNTDARHLRGLENILNKPIIKSFLISNDMDMRELDKNIIAVPAVKFLT